MVAPRTCHSYKSWVWERGMSWTVQGVCYIACHACVSNIYCNEVTHRNLASAWPCISWCAVGWLCERKEGLGCLNVWHMKLGCGFAWPILVKAYVYIYIYIGGEVLLGFVGYVGQARLGGGIGTKQALHMVVHGQGFALGNIFWAARSLGKACGG